MASTHVLVTGAAGLIGAAACRSLERRGIPHTAVWNQVEPAAHKRLQADLTREGALDDVHGVTAVVHSAAALPSSFADSADVGAINRSIDDRVLDAAHRWQSPVVFVSTTSLYPPHGGEPVDESAAIAPTGAYLAEKAKTEQLGFERADATGSRFTSLRVCAPYGVGQRSRTVLQLFVERALAGEALEYYGTGSREQDFTWADDIGEAIALALEGPGGLYNVATGQPVSMSSLAQIVASAAGLPPGRVRAAGRPDPQDGSKARFDVSAAARELGWRATTDVARGVARLLRARQ